MWTMLLLTMKVTVMSTRILVMVMLCVLSCHLIKEFDSAIIPSVFVTSASPPVCHSHWHLNIIYIYYIFLFLYVFLPLPHHTFSNTLTTSQMSTTIPQNLIFVKNPDNIYVAKYNWLCGFIVLFLLDTSIPLEALSSLGSMTKSCPGFPLTASSSPSWLF